MSRNKLKRKQDKQKKREAANKSKVLRLREVLVKKKKTEKETSDMQKEIEKLQNRLSGVTIRKPKESAS
tara:strand:- start:455 stop:661 length:207 start_codon:yes stop_codon:yes gene_type:complete